MGGEGEQSSHYEVYENDVIITSQLINSCTSIASVLVYGQVKNTAEGQSWCPCSPAEGTLDIYRTSLVSSDCHIQCRSLLEGRAETQPPIICLANLKQDVFISSGKWYGSMGVLECNTSFRTCAQEDTGTGTSPVLRAGPSLPPSLWAQLDSPSPL